MITPFDFKRKYNKYRSEVNSTMQRVLRRGVFILGPELEVFEKSFSTYLNIPYTVGVNSGTDALFLALKAVGVGHEDEVITVANTATPTVSAIRMAGATPVFVDIDEKTFNLDTTKLESKITKETKAIIPVHLYGYPAEMNSIMKVAKKYKLFIIEDCCQAHGAEYAGKKVGSFGVMGCYSFYPTKNLGTIGDAGAIVTRDKKLYEKLKALRNYGEASKYHNVTEGVNSRLDEIHAAFLSWGLPYLDAWNTAREHLADLYIKELHGAPLILPEISSGKVKRVWHQFVIRTDKRDALKKYLADHDVITSIHYPMPIFKQPAYKFFGYTDKDLPMTSKAAKEILSLPLYPELTNADVRRVCRTIQTFYKEN
ncbi:MAG: DegT/DnrJ/EryC1/StrS family aminotransferase [Candidatus Paceibacterota bacterium]|jgi:dTDP-4-amino-4,6-dideoxygalactose transaminase